MRAEGWYRDPYKIHVDRWFSDGVATELVRDGRTETHDPPPHTPYSGPLVEAGSSVATDGDDLRRADDGGDTGTFDPKKAVETALDSLPWGPVP